MKKVIFENHQKLKRTQASENELSNLIKHCNSDESIILSITYEIPSKSVV